MTIDHEPLDTDISEYGMTLYTPDCTLPRTTKLHRCPCAAWLWLPSDGEAITCDCGRVWAQRPIGMISEVEEPCSS